MVRDANERMGFFYMVHRVDGAGRGRDEEMGKCLKVVSRVSA